MTRHVLSGLLTLGLFGCAAEIGDPDVDLAAGAAGDCVTDAEGVEQCGLDSIGDAIDEARRRIRERDSEAEPESDPERRPPPRDEPCSDCTS